MSWINARRFFRTHKCAENLAVRTIGNALPYGVGGENFHIGTTGINQLLHLGGQEKLTFG